MYPSPPPPPPHWIVKVAVRQRPLVEGGSTMISIAFMFSPIYPRLEGKVPPTPKGLKFFLNMNAIEFFFCSIHV